MNERFWGGSSAVTLRACGDYEAEGKVKVPETERERERGEKVMRREVCFLIFVFGSFDGRWIDENVLVITYGGCELATVSN